MAFGSWRGRWRLLKELNPRSLRREADAPWVLSLNGEAFAAGRLARALLGSPAVTEIPAFLRLPPGAWGQEAGPGGQWRLRLRVADGSPHVGASAILKPAAGLQLQLDLLPEGAGGGTAASEEAMPLLRLSADGGAPDLAPLAAAIAAMETERPELGVALARRLPGLRSHCIARLIEEGARANAAYAFGTGLAEVAPGMGLLLAPADVFVLTKNQLLLAFKVALAAGRQEDNRSLVLQLLGVLGSGLLFRQIARELVGLLPVIGLLPKVAVAYAGTQVIGQVAWAWADEERRLTGPERHRLYHEALQAAVNWARRLLPQALTAGRTTSELGS